MSHVVRLKRKDAGDRHMVAAFLYSRIKHRKWAMYPVTFDRCTAPITRRQMCRWAKQFSGGSWHYCTMSQATRCSWAISGAACPVRLAIPRVPDSGEEPLRFGHDARTREIQSRWLKVMRSLDEGTLPRATASAWAWDTPDAWQVVDIMSVSKWPRLDRNERLMNAQMQLCDVIAVTADAYYRQRRDECTQRRSVPRRTTRRSTVPLPSQNSSAICESA